MHICQHGVLLKASYAGVDWTLSLVKSFNICYRKEHSCLWSLQTCRNTAAGKADLFEGGKEGLGAAILEVQGRQREAVNEHESDGGPGEGEGGRMPPHRLELVQRNWVHRIHCAICSQRHVSQQLKPHY